MLTYLKKNKQWLFSGIGVAIIMVVGTLVGRFLLEQLGSSISSKQTGLSQSPLTLEEFNRVRNDKALTELQKQDFMKKHEGRIVKWQGIVCNVEQANHGNAKSDIYVVYRPISQKDVSMPDVFIARFPYTAKTDLSFLSEGDQIEFEGKLETTSSGRDHKASVYGCTLLRHDKMTSQKEQEN